MSAIVRARIDEKTKEDDDAVLSAFTVSDAFRLMVVRIAAERRLPFEPLAPNDETIDAVKAARHGELVGMDELRRTIRRIALFKRDYKREKRGRFAKTLPEEAVAAGPTGLCRNAALPGPWKDRCE